MNSQEINEYIRTHPESSYSELSEVCGITADAIRKRYRKIHPPKKLNAQNSNPVESFERKIEREKSLLVTAQKNRIEKADIKREARHGLLVESIKEAISPLKFEMPSVILPKNGKPEDEEEAVLILSDLHFGKKTSSYNLDIAKKRFEKLVDAVIKIVNLHRKAYPIKKLNILWTGDIVDGASIYPTQSYHLDTYIVNQVFGMMPDIIKQLARLSCVFDEIHNHCIRGNHGRVSKEAHEEDNFDNIFYKAMELATINLPMTWNIPLDWKQIVTIRNTRILQYHGHQIRMVLNLPWYGITTRISRWAATEGLKDFDVAVQGHFHSSSSLRWNQKKIFTNGTLVSGDEFALEFIGLESSESQWLFGVHSRYKTTWQYEIKY